MAPFHWIEGLSKENLFYVRSQDHTKTRFNNQHFVEIFERISPETKQGMHNLATQSVLGVKEMASKQPDFELHGYLCINYP